MEKCNFDQCCPILRYIVEIGSAPRFYVLTLLKKAPKDFKYKQISQEISKQQILKPLYDFAKEFLPRLEISNDNIVYFGSLVNFYSIFRLRQLQRGITNVYLLCFIYHRYHRINDNLSRGTDSCNIMQQEGKSGPNYIFSERCAKNSIMILVYILVGYSYFQKDGIK